MSIEDRSEAFRSFRRRYGRFDYKSFKLVETSVGLDLHFDFTIGETIRFVPSLSFPKPRNGWKIDPIGPLAAKIAFCIGMVEAISYWKAYCPSKMEVKVGPLCDAERHWWKKLFFLGLGEFFFVNRIPAEYDTFLNITSDDETRTLPISLERTGRMLIPVGGGKDSLVSLELLRQERSLSDVLLMNAPRAAKEGSVAAGFSPAQIIEVERRLDPRLLELNNKQGVDKALNGHTPFSALLAFVSLFTAALTGSQFIVLSNESSANEPTVHDSHVNHQYSKSVAFERDFREYTSRFITRDIDYFSLLRPVNELQIASLLSAYPNYFSIFKSCNAGSRQGIWCGRCAKCLFAFLMLQPFLPLTTMISIFGKDLLDDEAQSVHVKELLGLSAAKPFDCVGTTKEVRAAVSLIATQPDLSATRRRLLERVKSEHADILFTPEVARAMLRDWNTEHFLPPAFETKLKELLHP